MGEIVISTLQFYGLDYIEKEFEEGTAKKWLYDHGVELETATANTSGGRAIKNSNNLDLYVPASTNVATNFKFPPNDFTPYSLIR